MKALVTGGTGFTGRHLARRLFDTGTDVRLLVRNRRGHVDFADFNPEIVIGDVRDADAVDKAIQGVDAIFHIAAVYRTAGISDDTYRKVHVEGVENLLTAAFKYKVQKFVHCSTVGVHGHIQNGPANETHPFRPGDIYQQTKLEGEIKAKEFCKKTGLPVAVVRPCAIYGPGDERLLKLFKLANRTIAPILGSGEIFYHMVYIDDLVDGFLLASSVEEAVGESFIIGGRERLTLNQLVDEIGGLLGRPPKKLHVPAKPFQIAGDLCEKICIPLGIEPPIYRRRIDFFTKSREFDISKAQNVLGYEPKVAIKEGLKRTLDWYRKEGHL